MDAANPLPTGCEESGSWLVPGNETSARGQGPGIALRAIEANLPGADAPRRRKENQDSCSQQKESLVPGIAALGQQRATKS